MKEFKIYSNGNIAFFDVSLGDKLDIAAFKLAKIGVILNKTQFLRANKGVDLCLSGKCDLSFGKNISIKIKTEFSGSRVIEFLFMWKVSSDVYVNLFLEQFKMFFRANNLKYYKKKSNECETYFSSGKLFDIWIDIPCDKNEFISFSIIINKYIQDQCTGEYNYKFIHELYMNYLDMLSIKEQDDKNVFSFKNLFK